MPVLAEHGTEPSHLPVQPLQSFPAAAQLAGQQAPSYLWIGCSDSRVPPEIVFDRMLFRMSTPVEVVPTTPSAAVSRFVLGVPASAPNRLTELSSTMCPVPEPTRIPNTPNVVENAAPPDMLNFTSLTKLFLIVKLFAALTSMP